MTKKKAVETSSNVGSKVEAIQGADSASAPESQRMPLLIAFDLDYTCKSSHLALASCCTCY